MGKRSQKKQVSLIVILLTIFVAMVMKPIEADAASKMSLNTKQVTVTSGMTQTLKIKNKKAKSKIKWYTGNKKVATVSSKGVVKGIKDGKTTIKCIVTSSGKKTTLKCSVIVKTPQFVKSSYTVNKGAKVQLSLKNKYSKSTYKWGTENARIAKVDSKGRFTGVGVGETNISVRILIPKTSMRSAKVITKKVKIIVKNNDLNRGF